MIIQGLDFETTGLDQRTDEVTEIGSILWDVGRKCPLDIVSLLISEPTKLPLTAHIVELTGITDQMITEYGIPLATALTILLPRMERADAVMVHGGLNLDRGMLKKSCERYGLAFPDKVWMDTQIDLPVPDKIKTRNLTHMAAEHGILNPFAHRALFDTITMLRMASNYDMEQAFHGAQTPVISVKAEVDFNGKEDAKSHGYFWHGPSKTWHKEIRECNLARERERVPFQITKLDAVITG